MATDDLVERLDAFAIDCDRDDHCVAFIDARARIEALEAQLAARDAEIAAWLRDQYRDELGGIAHTPAWIADAIEAGAYRNNPQ